MKRLCVILLLLISCFGCEMLTATDEVIVKTVKMTPAVKTYFQGDGEESYSFVGFDCEFSFEPYNLGLKIDSSEKKLCIWLEEPVNNYVKDKEIKYEMGATYTDLPMIMKSTSTLNVFCEIEGLNVDGWTMEEAEKLLSEMETLQITVSVGGITKSKQYVEIIK